MNLKIGWKEKQALCKFVRFANREVNNAKEVERLQMIASQNDPRLLLRSYF